MGVVLVTTSGCERLGVLPLIPTSSSSSSFSSSSSSSVPLILASYCSNSSHKRQYYSFSIASNKLADGGFGRKVSNSRSTSSNFSRRGIRPQIADGEEEEEEEEEEEDKRQIQYESNNSAKATMSEEAYRPGNSAILSACFVGLLTGIAVVLFNNTVHDIRDFFWDGIPNRGASWLREEPIELIWERVVAIPAFGGFFVGMLNVLRGTLESPTKSVSMSKVKAVLEPILKTLAACVTLGTGNSLGPEGPSVEIGASIAKGVSNMFDRSMQRKLSLVAAGSAAGISSGFNAAVAGCFFAVESVLWPSPAQSSSLTNATSMVILSAVIASVVSEIGLGSEPAFTVPGYDFRSPSELPLYLLLGILCGLISVSLSSCTSFMISAVDNISETTSIPKAVFPVLGGLAVGLMALAYPEILYWGFENVDILLESRPFVKGLSADLLLQLVAVKIVATSLSRACGLVGGYYAPSLFIGAATGMAYGKLITSTISQTDPIFSLSFLEVASPQAYGLVGMAATLAGVCQVPLTAVLLLFELTQDYRIVLPLLGAVGLSSWITSGYSGRKGGDAKKQEKGSINAIVQSEISSNNPEKLSSANAFAEYSSSANSLCIIESSLCVDDSNDDAEDLERRILVSQAMKTRYVTVLMGTLLTEAVNLMLAEKQSCAVVVDDDSRLIGLLTLDDIQEYSLSSKGRIRKPQELKVSDVCPLNDNKYLVFGAVTPDMTLSSARRIMKRHGTSQLPVIMEHFEAQRGLIIGLLDEECITLACRCLATRERLNRLATLEMP